MLEDSGAVLIFAETDAHADNDRALLDELPALRKVLRIDGSGTSALDALAEAGESVDAKQLDDRLAGLKSADPATLIYTSGTTGRPKGCQLTHSNLLYEIRGAKDCFPTLLDKGERMLVFLPLAHVLARASPSRRSRTRSRSASPATSRTWSRRSGCSSRPWWCRCRGCSRRSTTPPNRTPTTTARARSSPARRGHRHRVEPRPRTPEAPGLVLRAKHALFDRLVYGKLRAALGGDCRGAISGGAPLGARLGHFYRGVGPDHLRGLRPHRDQRRDHGEPGRRREGRVGRKVAAGQQHAAQR